MSDAIALLVDDAGLVETVLRDDAEIGLLVGQPVSEFLHEGSVDKLERLVEQSRREGLVRAWEITWLADGGSRVMLTTASHADGRLLLLGTPPGVDQDHLFTAMLRINNQQQNRIRDLLRSIRDARDRTADDALLEDFARLNSQLTNAQRDLHRKNVELERLNQRKNELLGVVAHDVRNPLSVIRGYAQLIESGVVGPVTEEQRQFLERIGASANFTLRLVEDLLDFSGIASGKVNLQTERFDLVALARDELGLEQVLAGPKSIVLELIAEQRSVHVDADAAKVRQIVQNLVSNAVKYSQPDTTTRLRVGADGPWAVLSVEDEGQGIPQDELANVFVPFARTSVKPTGGERSTGLGLSIARQIAVAHGGDLAVQSEVGRGSVFRLTLPWVE